MRISDWSSDVCSSDLWREARPAAGPGDRGLMHSHAVAPRSPVDKSRPLAYSLGPAARPELVKPIRGGGNSKHADRAMTAILETHARAILDPRGTPPVEVDGTLARGAIGRAPVPPGPPTAPHPPVPTPPGRQGAPARR